MKVPFLDLKLINKPFEENYQRAFKDFLDKGWYVLGEGLMEFEKNYAQFNNTKYCVGVGNGLDALILSLKALEIGQGDEVIVPTNTYIATWLAVLAVGAIPIPVEPDNDTCNINPRAIENSISSKTKAIIPVHLYGQVCEMDLIMEISRRYNLFVIEDNAQAQGAYHDNKISGSFGHINATSYYPGKNLGALGDGGAITTDDKGLAMKVSTLRNYGSAIKYNNELIGVNSRLDEVQALFLNIKLKKLHEDNRRRVKAGETYSELLKGIGDLQLPQIASKATSVYHLYVIRTAKRDDLQTFLAKEGIGSLIHYPIPPHLQKAFNWMGYSKGSFQIAESMADKSLSIPLWPHITEDQLGYVSDTIKRFFRS